MHVSCREGTNIESTHVRERCCSLLLVTGLLQWIREIQSVALNGQEDERSRQDTYTHCSICTFAALSATVVYLEK